MRDEYNFDELNPRKNSYVDKLTSLLANAMIVVSDGECSIPNVKPIAEYLAKQNVVIKDDKTIIELPCPIGTTLYRIDKYERACSYHHEHRDNLYYCVNDWKCRHLCDGLCDAGFEYKICTIQDASAMAILGNAELFGTDRLFLDKEEAEKALAKKQAEEIELRKQRGKELPPSYEGYREYWDDECEDDDE